MVWVELRFCISDKLQRIPTTWVLEHMFSRKDTGLRFQEGLESIHSLPQHIALGQSCRSKCSPQEATMAYAEYLLGMQTPRPHPQMD
jgi:hypothetical protein